MALKIQHRRGAKANLPQLSAGELGFTTDAGAEQLYIGNAAENANILLGRVFSGTATPAFNASLYPIGTFFFVDGGGDPDVENDLYISDGTAWVKVGVNQLSDLTGDLDDIADGTTYAKVLATEINAGKVTRVDDGTYSASASAIRSHIDGISNPHQVGLSQLIDYNAGGNVISNIGTPISNTDAVNKSYADSISSGLDPKESVRTATTTVLSNTMIADNGSPSAGERSYNTTNKTITWATGEGPTAIDSVTLANNDRILVKDESATSGPASGEGRIYNGIYVRTSADVWTRADDHDGSPANEISGGNYTFVEQGTTNQDSGWVLQGDGILTLQVDNIIFVQFTSAGTVNAGDGLFKTGLTIDLVKADSSLTINPDSVAVNVDDATLETDPTVGVRVKNDGITGSKLAPAVAGNGLSQDVDGNLQVANDGITGLMLNSSVAGSGLIQDGSGNINVNAGSFLSVLADQVILTDIDCGTF